MYGDRHIWAGIRQTASPKVNSRTVKKSSLHPQPDSHTITRADQDVNMGNLVGIFKALCNPSVCKVMPPSIFRSYTKCICSIAQSQPTLRPRGLEPARFLCPWHSPSKNTGVCCHFLLQGIFPVQGSNPCFLCALHWLADSLPLSHLGSPHKKY